MIKQMRSILCRNCSSWEQAPNVEQGNCTIEESDIFPTNYDTRCLFGLSETVDTPSIDEYIVSKELV